MGSRVAPSTSISSGTWTIRILSETSGTRRADFWLTYARIGAAPVFVQGKTESRLVMSPATADSVIAVGAYVGRPNWTALNGSTYVFPGAVQYALASFSAAGPRRDNVICPQITAPGCGLAVTRSVGYYPSTAYFMPDSSHCMTSGTSMAAALAGGCVALLLQDSTTYGRGQVLAVLKDRALVDGFTGTVPNAQWGWGKLRVTPVNRSAAVGFQEGASFGLKLISPTLSAGPKRFQFSISSAALLQGKASVTLRILDVAGRQIAKVPVEARSGLQTAMWHGESGSGSPAGAGVYWARLEVGEVASAVRFIVIH